MTSKWVCWDWHFIKAFTVFDREFPCRHITFYSAQSLTCVSALHSRLKMVCLCWLLVVVVAYVCVPGFGSVCRDNAICNDLKDKGRILVGPTVFSTLSLLLSFCVLSVTAITGRVRHISFGDRLKKNREKSKEKKIISPWGSLKAVLELSITSQNLLQNPLWIFWLRQTWTRGP